jgi:hypothetical protein
MSQWGRLLSKGTNLAFLNEINAIWFPYRRRAAIPARPMRCGPRAALRAPERIRNHPGKQD